MNSRIVLDTYKQAIADNFNERRSYDEESDFHPRLARRLVQQARIKNGQKILDIATGTGLAAIEAAQLVGPEGYVVGVDIAAGMLEQAQRKVVAAGFNNIELQLADAEVFGFPKQSFDVILCSSALVFLTDISAALQRWHRFLTPGGRVGFSGFAEHAFIAGILLRTVARQYGVMLPNWNEPTGTAGKCRALLQQAGFERIQIKTEQFGHYLSLPAARKTWEASLNSALCRQLQQLSSAQLQLAQADYIQELERLVTPRGIWNDVPVFFAFGHKSALSPV